LTSSIYPLSAVAVGGTITALNDILTTDIAITSEMVSPGGGGILRLYFSFDLVVSPTTIRVVNNGVFKGLLNADNGNDVTDVGYYRFDLDVEAGDNINLEATQDLAVLFIRAHLIQFGA